jgi:hypothetical protein
LALINEEIPIELLVLANFMHKNRVIIENLGIFSLKILGIFVSLPQKSRFMYYQRLIEDAIALKLKPSGAVQKDNSLAKCPNEMRPNSRTKLGQMPE